MKTRWLPTLDSRGIDAFIIRAMAAAASPSCAIVTHEFRGAAPRVPAAATAFGLRRDHVLAEILASGTTIPTILSCASSRKAGLSAGLWRANSVVAQYFATTGP
jgi:hypothetical protein